jgi:hypothetical protein
VCPHKAFDEIVAATGQSYCAIKVDWTRLASGVVQEQVSAYCHGIGYGEPAVTIAAAVENLLAKLRPDALRQEADALLKEAAELRGKADALEAKALENEAIAAEAAA